MCPVEEPEAIRSVPYRPVMAETQLATGRIKGSDIDGGHNFATGWAGETVNTGLPLLECQI